MDASELGDFRIVGKDVLGIIVKHITKGSRCNFICVNSTIMNLILERIWKPWIPVKNYLTSEDNGKNYYLVQLNEINQTKAMGLGLLFAISNCNYDYYVKWTRFADKLKSKFKSSWQNGIIYNYAFRVASRYKGDNKNNSDTKHIRLVELLMKDKYFKKGFEKFIQKSDDCITNEIFMEWLCKTRNYDKFYNGRATIQKSSPNIFKIYIKHYSLEPYGHMNVISISLGAIWNKNLELFKFLLDNKYFELTFRHINSLCEHGYWNEAYKYLVAEQSLEIKIKEIEPDQMNELLDYVIKQDLKGIRKLACHIANNYTV